MITCYGDGLPPLTMADINLAEMIARDTEFVIRCHETPIFAEEDLPSEWKVQLRMHELPEIVIEKKLITRMDIVHG